ncbi:hypothetical protein QO010_000077 [Caulobacter ginsengisoli]|uniref:Uncharacterized protein n=1 Tax=Caulobacter ginsengisoli TaxID=400775 RepID=A0ABU0IMU7_9CAUL|nr:hypothetical protein [Caulobacter ginsengisoli]MDQ0462329.1 hypothetical protein [Caulobacter ginsengisoli]
MNLQDYWMTAVGKRGDPVPVPVDVRNPIDVRAVLRIGLFSGGAFAGLGVLRIMLSPQTSQGGLGQHWPALLLLAIICGLVVCAIILLTPLALWPLERRRLGEGLEATADAWSLSELDRHIQDIRSLHAKAHGPEKALHGRHLAWLEARRETRVDLS